MSTPADPSNNNEIVAKDAEMEASRRRKMKETYTQALMINTDLSTVTKFISEFNNNLPQFEKDFQMHLESYEDLSEHYKSLSNEVAHKTFMQRYFYRCGDLMRISRELEAASGTVGGGAREGGGNENGSGGTEANEELQDDNKGRKESRSRFGREGGNNRTTAATTVAPTRDSKIRFGGVAGADPNKRSAWRPEEAGKQASVAAAKPPTEPFRRMSSSTGINDNDSDQQPQTQRKISSNPNIKPALKHPTSPKNSGNTSASRHRWIDRGKYSPKNSGLHMPVRQISRTANESLWSDDANGSTQQKQQDTTQEAGEKNSSMSPSIQSKVAAWNMTKNSAGSQSPTTNHRASLTPPNIPDLSKSSTSNKYELKRRQEVTSGETEKIGNDTKDSSSPTTQFRTPGPEGSATDFIEKLESSKKIAASTKNEEMEDGGENGNNGKVVRKWKPINKKPPKGPNNNPQGDDGADDAKRTVSNDNGKIVKAPNKGSSWKEQLKRHGSQNKNKDTEEANQDESAPPSQPPPKKLSKRVSINTDKNETITVRRPSWADSPLVLKSTNSESESNTQNSNNDNKNDETTTPASSSNSSSGNIGFSALPFISPGGGGGGNEKTKPSTNHRKQETGDDSNDVEKDVQAIAESSAWSSYSGNSTDAKKKSVSSPRQSRRSKQTPKPNTPESQTNSTAHTTRPSWVKSRVNKQSSSGGHKQDQSQDQTVPSHQVNDVAAVEPPKSASEGQHSRVRRGRPSTYRSSSRRSIAASANTSSRDETKSDAAATAATTTLNSDTGNKTKNATETTPRTTTNSDAGGNQSTSSNRSSVRDRLKQWGGKRETSESNAPLTTERPTKASSFSDRRSSRSGRPSNTDELNRSQSSQSSRSVSGSSRATRRSRQRSRSPTSAGSITGTYTGERRSLRSSSPGIRHIDGAPSAKDRLSNWGSGQLATAKIPGGDSTKPNKYPPKPTRSSDSLDSMLSEDTSFADWKPDPLAVKSVIRAERRRNAEDTYSQALDLTILNSWEDESELEQFLGSFDLGSLEDDIQIVLAKHKTTVGFHFKRLVPAKVSVETFWKCYFYRCDEKRILRDLRRRESYGTLGQSMVFDNSTTAMSIDIVTVSKNEPPSGSRVMSGDSNGNSKKKPASFAYGGRESIKPKASGQLQSDMNSSQTISEKILKADETSVISRGSLINRLKQWNGKVGPAAESEKKVPAFIRKESITAAPGGNEAAADDVSMTSFTITDELEGGEMDDGPPSSNIHSTTTADDASAISRTGSLVKARLQNWAKIATGGKVDTEGRNNQEPRRALSVPISSGKKKLLNSSSDIVSESSPLPRDSAVPTTVVGSPESSKLEGHEGNPEEKGEVEPSASRSVKPSDFRAGNHATLDSARWSKEPTPSDQVEPQRSVKPSDVKRGNREAIKGAARSKAPSQAEQVESPTARNAKLTDVKRGNHATPEDALSKESTPMERVTHSSSINKTPSWRKVI